MPGSASGGRGTPEDKTDTPDCLETWGTGSQKPGLRALRKHGEPFPRAPPKEDLWFGLQRGELLNMQIMGTNLGVAGKAARQGGGALEVWLQDHVCGWGPAAPDGAAHVPVGEGPQQRDLLPTSSPSLVPPGQAS